LCTSQAATDERQPEIHPPATQEQQLPVYHHGIALLLLSLTFDRGLFHYESIHELFNGDERNIQQKEDISAQTVFLAPNQSGALIPEPVQEKALNGKLREMCDLVGLYRRTTIYPFRRGAIVDQRRKRGSEAAKILAGHSADGNTISVYDEDIANIRYGSESANRESIRELFSFRTTRLAVACEDSMANMAGAILDQGALMTKEANERAKNDTKILDLNDALTAALSDAKQLIIARGVDSDLMTNNLDILDQLNSSVATGDAECGATVTKIDGIKPVKRYLLRVLRRAARVAIKKEWAGEAEKSQRLASGTNRAGSRG
jgi:hypothetical protein